PGIYHPLAVTLGRTVTGGDPLLARCTYAPPPADIDEEECGERAAPGAPGRARPARRSGVRAGTDVPGRRTSRGRAGGREAGASSPAPPGGAGARAAPD